jgi:hypothetical protein
MIKKIVFNAKKWNGKDVGDNSRFYEVATIIRQYTWEGDDLADVEWSDGSISRGHFVSAMLDVP